MTNPEDDAGLTVAQTEAGVLVLKALNLQESVHAATSQERAAFVAEHPEAIQGLRDTLALLADIEKGVSSVT